MTSDWFTDWKARQHALVRRGILPCRWCGLDAFDEWDGQVLRHDPVKMAGVSTPAGRQRHWSRRWRAGWGHLGRELNRNPRRFWFRFIIVVGAVEIIAAFLQGAGVVR